MKQYIPKKYLLTFLLVSLPAILVLFFFDTRIWQAARDLLNQKAYYITDLITTKGLFLFYAVFCAVFYSLIKKNKKLWAACLPTLKRSLFLPLYW